MEYTEDIYENIEEKFLCRIIEKNIKMIYNGDICNGLLYVGLDGIKTAIPKTEFNKKFILYKFGEEIV